MTGALRFLGWIVLVAGVCAAGLTAGLFAGDGRFAEIAAGYARHPDNPLFQVEYTTAAVRHYGLLLACVVSLAWGLSAGAMLLALAEMLRRLRPEP